VTLLSGRLRTACNPTVRNCTTARYSPLQTVTLGLPESPIVPQATIRGAGAVSICDNLVVDASLSAGSGGRPMYFTWSVAGPPEANTTDLEAWIDSLNPPSGSMTFVPGSYYGISTLRIEPRWLLAPGTYALSLSLRNFLGASSTVATTYVTVLNDAFPSVRILAGAAITMYR
jgi:hypothetical protein